MLARQAGQVALVQAASDASAIITGGQLMIALNSGIGMPINIQTLSLAESAKVFGMMLSILQDRQTALTTQLTAIA